MAASVISPLTGLGCYVVLPLIGDQKLTPVSLSSPPVDGLCNGYFAFASALVDESFQALSPDILLQVVNLRGYPVDSTSETVIIEFSICCKSWAFSIAHAAGSGR